MKHSDLHKILTEVIDENTSKIFYGRVNPNNFEPKKKPSFKERFKNMISNIGNKIKKAKILVLIKNWFNKTIIQPIKTKRAKIANNRDVKLLKKNFSKRFNVDVEEMIKLMNSPGYSPSNIDNNQLLIENRLEINKRKSLYKFAPFIYDVDIVDIHNENLNSELPTINEIKINDNLEVSKTLDKQHRFFVERPELTKRKVQRKN
jgi:hypothetical protein